MQENEILGIVTLIYLASFITWIFQLVRLSGRKSKVAFWLILIFGIILFPFHPLTTFISLFLGRGKETKEKEEENKDKYFWCGICQIKCDNELFGAETLKEGKICRFCLIARRKEKERKEN